MSTEPPAPPEPLHITWNNMSFTLRECRLACALTIYVKFEDGSPLNIDTINKVVALDSKAGSARNVEGLDFTGLVEHLQVTKDVFPEVEAARDNEEVRAGWANWARGAYNRWLDPQAAPVGTWL